jgi:pimeloyl-ACP methyl ester carboxylesterase
MHVGGPMCSGSSILPRMTDRLSVRTVTANGLRFGVLEVGCGPLALCLHGFPDSARTWRHLLPALADGGFHAVAPFMRGYAPTEIPADGCFQVGALVADAVGLHDALDGDDQAVLIGHDWGAEAAYGAAVFAPDRWRRLVTLAVPPLALDAKIFADYDQLKRFFYLFLLKTPLAESVLAADDMAFLDRLWQDWSPGYDAHDDLRNVKQCLRHERTSQRQSRTTELTSQRSTSFARTVCTPERRRHWQALRRSRPSTCMGTAMACIDLALVADAERHLAPGSRMKVIESAGHFPHLEQPAAVNDQILAWISA